MHKDLKNNMENLVEKLGIAIPVVKANMQSIESMQRSEIQDLK
jgi:hypothetical protein